MGRELFRLGCFVLISNVVSLALVVVIELMTAFFGIRHWSDYAFFVLVLLWGCSALLYMYPPAGGFGASSDVAERLTDSMVDRTASDEVDEQRFSSNTIICIRFAIAGLPALFYCVAQSFMTS
ncbi:MAG: hypothetical protein HWE19_19345 [Vibrionaceae bacterium]|nr:hypothetical protein [Vibrionaceae bacterium]